MGQLKMCWSSRFLIALAFIPLGPSMSWSQSSDSSPLFKKSDRVVFVGDGLIERAQSYGLIESRLGLAFADLNLTFRNLGWSGDTPKGLSRDHYTNPPTGYDHLVEQITSTNPDVLMIGYGGHLAFGEEDSVESFIGDLSKLIDDLPAMKIVLLSPISHEEVTSTSDRTTEYNANLYSVSVALAELAKGRNLNFVDLTTTSAKDYSLASRPHTLNGIHLNRVGYARVADLICLALNCPQIASSLDLDIDGTSVQENLKREGSSLDLGIGKGKQIASSIQVLIEGLPKGEYELIENGELLVRASHKRWAKGMEVQLESGSTNSPRLLNLIKKKNQKYFNQYRPQNETYLVGFRRYEQGNNADELALADPIISDLENEIARMYKSDPTELILRRIN